MAVISIQNDLARLRVTLDDIGRRQLPFATAMALTRAAYDARADLRSAMERAFDRPKPFTLNATQVDAARKNRLEARVSFRDFAPKGVPAGRYLRAQILGGPRALKAHERLLQRAGLLPSGHALIPTRHADQDAHGNINAGQLQKILSALKAQRDPGQNIGVSGRASRGRRAGESYFAVMPGGPQGRGGRGGGLPPAIYKVTASGLGRIVLPVMTYVRSAPSYTTRLDFDGVTMASIERHLPGHIGRALDDAMRTARR